MSLLQRHFQADAGFFAETSWVGSLGQIAELGDMAAVSVPMAL